MTRLRVEVTDPLTVSEDALTAAGIKAMMRVEEQILHLVVGLNAEQYAKEINKRLQTVA